MAISDTPPPAFYLRGGKKVVPFDVTSRQIIDPQTGEVRLQYEYEEQELAADATDDEIAAAKAIAKRKSLAKRDFKSLKALAGKTDQQIIDYINANVTDLATAKDVLRLLARAVGMLARSLNIED